jgi:radical SAM protein with 4Fe4S-binding SPASM domain
MPDDATDTFPDVLRIEAVGLCNFNCVHCPTGTAPNNRRVLRPEKFHEILDQLKAQAYVPRVVVLYHGGEPLLNKNLASYVSELKAYGVGKTVITTNASLLTADRARELILAGLDQLKVSFDGESADENDQIRVNGDFRRDAGNLLAFLRIKKELGRLNPDVVISNIRICDEKTIRESPCDPEIVFDRAPAYLEEFFAEFKDEIVFQSSPAMVWPGYEKFGSFFEVDLPPNNPTYCALLFETTTIMSNGDIVPCCYDLPGEAAFGNVSDKTPFEIWRGPEYTKFRNDFRERKYSSLCEKCLYVRPRYLCRS